MEIPDVAALRGAVADAAVKVIVFERGRVALNAALLIRDRDDLTLCGASSDATEVTLESSDADVVRLDAVRRIVIQNMTLRATSANATALRLSAAISGTVESYVSDVSVERCSFDASVGVAASVRARGLSIVGSRFTVRGPGDPALPAGVGVLWEDGPGLFVGRCDFTTAPGAAAYAGVFVRGAESSASEGERAHRVVLSRNRVDGDFARGLDLADVADARVRGNSVTFPGPLTDSAENGVPAGSGRIGVVVRHGLASSPTEDFELFRNQTRRGYYGAWIDGTGDGVVRANDFRTCGAPLRDPRLAQAGGGIRLDLRSGLCGITVERNDLRSLRTPVTDPAVIALPAGREKSCFPFDTRNRVDRGRDLYLGEEGKQ